MKEFDYQFLFLFMQKNERMQGNDRIKNESFLCNDVNFLDVFCNLFFFEDKNNMRVYCSEFLLMILF